MTAPANVPLPPGSAHAARFPDTDPDTGSVVFTARPARAAWAVGQDLLGGLGKRDDVTGAGRNHDEDLNVIHAWLSAHRVRQLVVRHADNLGPAVLDSLTELAAGTGVALALVHDDGDAQHVVDHVARHGGETVVPECLLARMPPAAPADPDDSDACAGIPAYLPRVAFPLFRAACRDLLAHDEARAVDTAYVAAFRAWRTAAPTEAADAHALLTGLLAACASPAEAVVVLRAAQASALVLGHHLKVDIRTLLIEAGDGRHRRLTDTETKALRAYRQPWRATAVVLWDADVPTARITTLTLGDVQADGTLPDIDHAPFGDHARTYLRAQRTVRLLDGAGPTSPLIEVNSRHLNSGLVRASSDLNLPIRQVKLSLNDRRADRWRHTLGLSLLPLTGNAVTPRTDPDGTEGAAP